MPVKFCAGCQNMLYPREDKVARRQSGIRQLLYACKNCDKVQIVDVPDVPIHKNVIVHTAMDKQQTQVDIASDPALPHTYNARCPRCEHNEAVYYQSPVGKNDEALVLIFICTNVNCKHKWLSSDQD